MNQGFADVAAFCAILVLIGWGLYLVFQHFKLSMQLKSQRIESFNRIVEKFGNSKEFIQFTESPQGKKIIEDPVTLRPNPLNKVLRFLQSGILAVVLGGAFWLNGMRLSNQTDAITLRDASTWLSMGTLLLFMGVGLLIVAGVSYVFVRRWHLANGETKS